MAETTLPAPRPQAPARRRAFFGLFDADGWSWASVKAIFWFVVMIMLLGYLPDRAYYFTVQQTVDLGPAALVADQLLPAGQRDAALPRAERRDAAVASVAARDPAPGRAHRRRRRGGRARLPLRRRQRRQGRHGRTCTSASAVGSGNLDVWKAAPSLPEARSAAAGVVIGNTLYVIGGYGPGRQADDHRVQPDARQRRHVRPVDDRRRARPCPRPGPASRRPPCRTGS